MTKIISPVSLIKDVNIHDLNNDHHDNSGEQTTSGLFELFITAHSVPVDNDHGQETGLDAHDGCQGTHRAVRVQV
jgi:hypothetical protein